MKATGIVRRIDDLGRVVIPKEIRRTLRIREGDPLEIYTDREGEIILKKYSPIGELIGFAKDYGETLAQASGHAVCIIDRDQIISVSGAPRKEFLDRRISAELERKLAMRTPFAASKTENTFVSIVDNDDKPSYSHQAIAPIICDGEVVGAVVMVSADKKMDITEVKLVLCAATFLGKQMEA